MEPGKKEKIIFFFPWKEISGGPNYLTGLANHLAEDNRYEVYYVDYSPGLSDSLLTENVLRIPYREPVQLDFQDPITLITPIYSARFIPNIHPKSKICFVNWHNFCIQALVDSWRLSDDDLQKFLRMVYENNAVFFLDKTHLMAQNERIRPKNAYQFRENFVPAVTTLSTIRCESRLVAKNEVHVAILGRLTDDKVFGVINLLEQIELLHTQGIIHIYMIGDGERKEWITSRNWGKNIRLHFMGTIVGNDLKRFLANNVDILFAMGMSLMEGAVIALPSVVLPHNIKKFNSNRFTYLQESKGYALGWYDTQIDEIGVPTHQIGEIFRDVYEDGKKRILGDEARLYVEHNHLSNISQFRKVIAGSTLTYGEIKQFGKHQANIRILGIPVGKVCTSFDGSIKSVSFLGIKNLFQYQAVNGERTLLFRGRPQRWILAVKEDGKYRGYLRIPFLKF